MQSHLHTACLLSSEVSNSDQTTHDRSITLAMDQLVEAMNGLARDRLISQRACNGIVLLTMEAKTAQRTWSTYEKNSTDFANKNRHGRRTPS